jgi:hypothetical protein
MILARYCVISNKESSNKERVQPLLEKEVYFSLSLTLRSKGRGIVNEDTVGLAKSKERKKQNKDVLDTKRAIDLVVRDAGGEKELKELFLKEQYEKIIDQLATLNPVIAETFGQHREVELQVLNELIVDLEISG